MKWCDLPFRCFYLALLLYPLIDSIDLRLNFPHVQAHHIMEECSSWTSTFQLIILSSLLRWVVLYKWIAECLTIYSLMYCAVFFIQFCFVYYRLETFQFFSVAGYVILILFLPCH